MEIEGSKVLASLLEHPEKTGYILEGGSRSTKTWSIIQWIILYCQKNKDQGKRITISRDRLTWLKDTVFKDFREYLKMIGWWNEKNMHNRDMTYNLFGNEISFIGLDEAAKLHGRKQNVFWINELIGTPGSAYNATQETFDQLEMRTTEFWFLDYNPKTTSHWVYDITKRDDVLFSHSTMLDNPFLEEKIIRKIKGYEPTVENVIRGTADDTKWKIYGLGKRAVHHGIIFSNINWVKEIPADARLVANGLDFGFTNDVTALEKVYLHGGELWINELIYSSGLLNTDIMRLMGNSNVGRQLIIADSAEQKSIAEIRSKGWNIEGAVKGPDSVSNGIDILKRYKINITERSAGMKVEAENYVWKENKQTGEFLNVPIDDFNHGWDAIRYVALNCINKAKPTGPRSNVV